MDRLVFRKVNDRLVKGIVFNVILNRNDYYLVDLTVYADGYIDCLGPIDITKLHELLGSGTLTRKLPTNSKLFIPHIGFVWTEKVIAEQTNEGFIELIQNTLDRLKLDNDYKGECIQRFKEYLIEPSEVNLRRLTECYFLIPVDERALFEHKNKDPLVAIMTNKTTPDKVTRRHLLEDYFEGEWIEIK